MGTVPAHFNGVSHPFYVYIGTPCSHLNPVYFQAKWLKEIRAGDLPQDVQDSFTRHLAISIENQVLFEDLCVYALGAANEVASDVEQSANINSEAGITGNSAGEVPEGT